MAKHIELTSKDPILKTLNFKPHKSTVERHFERFLPKPGEPDKMEVPTPWGESLTAKAGDYLLSEMDDPDDSWPVDADVFKKSYEIVRPGLKQFAPVISILHEDRMAKFGLIQKRRSQT